MKIKQLLISVLLLWGTVCSFAQQMPSIPIDSKVRIGHLSNGLTYYIRHNDYPEHVASFYIAQKVGSINENDDQRGLAHLLEHLAFNGSDHFKDNDLQEYLQSIGVEYGRNLNAYTSIDQTVYFFTDVPTTRATAIDSCMLILKDWSNGITLTQKAINDERDVVHNEYRMRMSAQQRILERALPKLYPGSKYGYRMPIGLMSVVDGCSPETLRAYYHKWYRPDNQAIIVVGDVDVDHIEAKIKELFGGIKVPANAPKVIPEKVPDNDSAIYVVDKDKEQQYDIILTMMKHEATPDSLKNGVDYLAQQYVKSVIASMLNARYEEKANDPDCPYLQASAYDGQYLLSRTKDAFTIQALAKSGKVKEAYAAALEEAKRARDFGFTATEYQRAKEDFLSSIEKIYTNRDKMKNSQFTGQYVDHFISNEPIPSVEDEYKIDQMIVPNIPLKVVNAVARELIAQSDTNFVTLVMMQEKDGAVYPSEGDLKNIVAKVRTEKLTAYVDNVKQEPLIAKLPKAGKITKVKDNKALGFKELQLSNGARVILKKTDFKDDEIRFSARADGGETSFAPSDYMNISMASSILGSSGLGDFSNTELDKALAGKQASVNFSTSTLSHGLVGTTTPKDLETLMQLIYLRMTAVSKDEKSVNNLKNTYSTILANQSKNPNIVFMDSVSSTLYKGSKLFRVPTSADIQSIDYDRVLEIAKELYGNAGNFTFYFVGNFDETKLLPFIEQYIASLPGAKGNSLKLKEVAQCQGEVKNIFTKGMENPQSQVSENWRSDKAKNTLQNRVVLDIASRMLDMNYNRTIREKESAAYHAGADCSVRINPDKTIYMAIAGEAQLNPEKAEKAIPYFFTGLKETISSPDASDLYKVKEILLKQADVDAKTNGYWINVLSDYVEDGLDVYTDYKNVVRNTTPQMISNFLKDVILKSGNHAEIIMNAVKN